MQDVLRRHAMTSRHSRAMGRPDEPPVKEGEMTQVCYAVLLSCSHYTNIHGVIVQYKSTKHCPHNAPPWPFQNRSKNFPSPFACTNTSSAPGRILVASAVWSLRPSSAVEPPETAPCAPRARAAERIYEPRWTFRLSRDASGRSEIRQSTLNG